MFTSGTFASLDVRFGSAFPYLSPTTVLVSNSANCLLEPKNVERTYNRPSSLSSVLSADENYDAGGAPECASTLIVDRFVVWRMHLFWPETAASCQNAMHCSAGTGRCLPASVLGLIKWYFATLTSALV